MLRISRILLFYFLEIKKAQRRQRITVHRSASVLAEVAHAMIEEEMLAMGVRRTLY